MRSASPEQNKFFLWSMVIATLSGVLFAWLWGMKGQLARLGAGSSVEGEILNRAKNDLQTIVKQVPPSPLELQKTKSVLQKILEAQGAETARITALKKKIEQNKK